MARNKVVVRYIANDAIRKEVGKKRTISLIKKAGELSILCGIDVGLLVLPESESSPAVVYPSSLLERTRIVDRFKSMPEVDRCRKNMDEEDYLQERIDKIQVQLRKAEHDNRQRETMLLLHDAMVGRRSNLEGLATEQLIRIGWATETLVKKIKDCIAYRSGPQAIVKADPYPYVATVATDVEAPHLKQGWVMEVVKAARDVDTLAYSGSRTGSGSYGTVGAAGGDVMQLVNMDARFGWAYPGTFTAM